MLGSHDAQVLLLLCWSAYSPDCNKNKGHDFSVLHIMSQVLQQQCTWSEQQSLLHQLIQKERGTAAQMLVQATCGARCNWNESGSNVVNNPTSMQARDP